MRIFETLLSIQTFSFFQTHLGVFFFFLLRFSFQLFCKWHFFLQWLQYNLQFISMLITLTGPLSQNVRVWTLKLCQNWPTRPVCIQRMASNFQLINDLNPSCKVQILLENTFLTCFKQFSSSLRQQLHYVVTGRSHFIEHLQNPNLTWLNYSG